MWALRWWNSPLRTDYNNEVVIQAWLGQMHLRRQEAVVLAGIAARQYLLE